MASTALDLRNASQMDLPGAVSQLHLIQLRQVCKVYRSVSVETMALDNIDLDVRRGEFLAVMGPSGCGKSTLLNIVAMLDAPTSGSYRLDGREMAGASERSLGERRRGRVGFVFQSFNLINELTVYENVELPLLYAKTPRSERHDRVMGALGRVDLLPRAAHWPGQLSGGQQQRVAVARAIVGQPELLVADEPTGNLDTAHGNEIMDMLAALHADGSTLIVVTHSPMHAERASRIVQMLDGRIVS